MRSSASDKSATISRFLLLLKFVRCYSPCHIYAASVEIKCFNAPLEIVSDIGVQLFYFQICVPWLQMMLDLLCHSWFSVW